MQFILKHLDLKKVLICTTIKRLQRIILALQSAVFFYDTVAVKVLPDTDKV